VISRAVVAILAMAAVALAHEGGLRNSKPTKARKKLDAAARKLADAKKQLAAAGRYRCSVRPSCDLCARTTGSCNCGPNAAAGRGVCGECLGGWRAGRGAVKSVDSKSVRLLSAEHQSCPLPGAPPSELAEAAAALMDAKRELTAEKRFTCCIRGGCGQCAHEAECPCGASLASKSGNGVCGDCLDGWHSGHGSFAGVDSAEVELARMDTMSGAMTPGGGPERSWYVSGTSQQPWSAPMRIIGARAAGWDLMASGTLFAVHTNQNGPRGRDKFFSTNWVMPMASRRVGPGTLTLRSMLSFEPASVTHGRYPLLLQTGETHGGIPIVNGQHPHDFFMELAASYQLRLGERTALNVYGGPRGEPALGPPAYPHRVSASESPVAVLSHHFQDSTHIASNVMTVGITHRALTLEASGFHGREPDEARWGLESGAIDSFATRLTIAPGRGLSGQFSMGRVNNRESTHPLRDTLRTSASATYVRPLAAGFWATTAIWGRSHDLEYTQQPFQEAPVAEKSRARSAMFLPQHIVTVPTRIPGQIYNSFLIESTMRFRSNHWIWGRAENTDKDSLVLYEEAPFLLLIDEQRYTRVQAYTAGYARELPSPIPWVSTAIGGQVTAYRVRDSLRPLYGDVPVAGQIFLRLRLNNGGY
jgi:hypothetical protein